MIRWIGAIFVVGACGACGFSMAASYRLLEQSLRQLQSALELMQCQMSYRLTELPELCGILSTACTGVVGRVFRALGQELQKGECDAVSGCMTLVLARTPDLPEPCREIFRQMGKSLGQLDLSGQLSSLAALNETVKRHLDRVSAEKAGRIRCYRALSLCGGAALALLLL
ncbi:MAG: stage III sporulation protein AB [Candidatus Faecousia sp.]|nr:stage III sporulation protein AB [Clostridiales bacterium]MDD7651884.1 stage III sporulation protein AB [Bacillota bacterium]MDY4220393.1 stage III sporulation protein AB [Candidatus Faecousia sp.]